MGAVSLDEDTEITGGRKAGAEQHGHRPLHRLGRALGGDHHPDQALGGVDNGAVGDDRAGTVRIRIRIDEADLRLHAPGF